jgi:hypothetical protein
MDTASITISINLSEFLFSFDKNKKVSSIRQNQDLIRIIKEKLAINSELIKPEFFFYPSLNFKNELIGDWIKRDKDPKITIQLKQSETSKVSKVERETLKIRILDVMQLARKQEIDMKIDDAIQKIDEKNKALIIEIRKEKSDEINIFKQEVQSLNKKVQSLNKKNDELNGINNLHPLLDFVSKFHLKIVQQLIEDNKVPANCTDWNTMFKYLEEKNNTRKLWSIIDDAVEKLGLKFEDWIVLKETSSFINSQKHLQPGLTKEQAFTKIELLNGTTYARCCEPLKNIVNLFEEKKWL